MVDIVGRCNLGCIYCNEGVRANVQPQTSLGLEEFTCHRVPGRDTGNELNARW